METPLRRFEASARTHLLILIAALVVPIAVFAGLVLFRFAEAERTRYQTAALNASERIAAATDRELAGLETALQALATGRSFGERAYDRFYERALEVKRVIKADVILKDSGGQQLMNTRVPFGTPLPSSLQEHERRAIELRRAEVSDLFVGAFSGRPIIAVALPLFREGAAVDLLTIAIEPERLSDVLQSQALPEGWTAAIVDSDGTVIARTGDDARSVAGNTPPEGEGASAADKTTWLGTTAAGSPALLAAARPQLAVAWRVIVGVPVAIAQAPLRRALGPLAAAGALALLVSGAVAAWMGRQAAGDMAHLARSAAALGALQPVLPVVTPVREINLVSAALAGAARDLEAHDSERRLAEDELRRLNEDLEAEIEKRTAQLVQLQKLEAIGQLTGGIAHDFNNLLMAVLGSLELLGKRLADDPRAVRLLDNAVQGARRGSALTQRLLAFARRQELVPVAVDVPSLVRGMSDLLRRSLGPQVRLDLQLPAELPPATADANQLELAVLNLAVNGRDAMGQGGRITIEARTEDATVDRPRSVVLSVSDTGAGMDAETLRRAAEPFFTTKGIGKGTGLGLSMVHGLAQQLGGELVLHSRPGIGTRAELWLPVADGSTPAAHPVADRAVDHRLAAMRILLVDDDPLVLASTADLLEDLGHDVVEASSAREALDLLDAGTRIDLVVTDYAMPLMTGVELIDRVRRSRPGLPTILATGFAEAPDPTGAPLLRLGKPFTQAALADAVAQAFGSGEIAGELS